MAPVSDQQAGPSAPPQEQNQFPPNYQRIYPHLQTENSNSQVCHGSSCLSDSIPPPAYDDINYR